MSDQLDIPPGMRTGLASSSYRPQARTAGMDPGTRKLALMAGGLGGCLLLMVGAWSLMGHRSQGIPVVQADTSPLRVKPADPGGMQVAGANEEILSGGRNGTTAQAIAPAPEAPDPQALRAQAAADKAAARTAQAAAPAPTPLAAPQPAPATPAPRSAPTVAAQQAPAPVPAAPAPRVAAAQPAARAADKPADKAADKPAASAPSASVPSASVLGAAQAPAHHGGTQVQLAALSTQEAAAEEWKRLAHRMPDLLGRHSPDIAKAEVNGRTFWRLRTTGFSDVAQANSFCEQVRAKGGGCSVASF